MTVSETAVSVDLLEMRFFDRKQEIQKLHDIERLSCNVAQFTVMSGRRRIGKTSLLREAFRDCEMVYLFVARKAEADLCLTFQSVIEESLGVPSMGTAHSFADIFRYLMMVSKNRHFTLVIDEFQEFYRINSSIYSEMQNIWDANKSESKINLVVCGSVNSLLNKIFRDNKEPLFGRQTNMMKLRAFAPSVLKEIMAEYHPTYSADDLLTLYMLTGGVAKYVEIFVDHMKLTHDEMMSMVFERDSYFLNEGKVMLIDEFGKDYGIYFSILSLISQGVNTRGNIEDMLKMEIGGYLSKLIDDYELVKKTQPVFEKSANKNVHYALTDQFLCYWFRFVYKYSYILEVGGNQKLLDKAKADYKTYSGRCLEDFFRDKMIESGKYTQIGYWHDRKGENEIDIIAADEMSDTVTFYEVKRQSKDVNIGILHAKKDVMLQTTKRYADYSIECRGLSMDDM